MHLIRCLKCATHSEHIDYFLKVFIQFLQLDVTINFKNIDSLTKILSNVLKLKREETYFDDKNTSLCFYELIKTINRIAFKKRYANETGVLLDLYIKIQNKQTFPKWCEKFIYFYAMLFHFESNLLDDSNEFFS